MNGAEAAWAVRASGGDRRPGVGTLAVGVVVPDADGLRALTRKDRWPLAFREVLRCQSLGRVGWVLTPGG